MGNSSFFGFFKDLLFPIFCLDCEKEGTVLCQDCRQKLQANGEYFCPVCHVKTSQGKPCDFCKSKTFLSSHIAVFPYHEGDTMSKLIHEWKYNWVEDCEKLFQLFFEEFFQIEQRDLFQKIDVIVPVPLHKKRQAERGFNQVEKLAVMLGKILQKPVQNILVRKKYTEQQAKLGKSERQKNVCEAFALAKNISGDSLQGKNILVVDDVLTTSATLNECAKILKQAGVGEVHGFTLARG